MSCPLRGRLRDLSPAHRALWVLVIGHALAILLSTWLIFPRLLIFAALPAMDPWFIGPLRSPIVYAAAVVGPALFGLYVALRPAPAGLALWAWWTFFGGAIALVHQMSFAWAGAVLLFWVGAWAVWLAHVKTGIRHGPLYALLLLGLLFAYPALGKLTPGYLSGNLFWEHHWRHDVGLAGWFNASAHSEVVRPFMAVFGPLAIAVEGTLALVWLMPHRIAHALIALGAMGILAGGGLRFMTAMGLVLSLAASGLALSEMMARESAASRGREARSVGG